jgi:hypothetical protein
MVIYLVLACAVLFLRDSGVARKRSQWIENMVSELFEVRARKVRAAAGD